MAPTTVRYTPRSNTAADANGMIILGDPTGYPAVSALPADPLMLESVDARTGANPVTGRERVPDLLG